MQRCRGDFNRPQKTRRIRTKKFKIMEGEIIMKTNDLKNKNAITLIALIVTLIVLLILAGVSIAVLTGENRNFKQSNRGKNNK